MEIFIFLVLGTFGLLLYFIHRDNQLVKKTLDARDAENRKMRTRISLLLKDMEDKSKLFDDLVESIVKKVDISDSASSSFVDIDEFRKIANADEGHSKDFIRLSELMILKSEVKRKYSDLLSDNNYLKVGASEDTDIINMILKLVKEDIEKNELTFKFLNADEIDLYVKEFSRDILTGERDSDLDAPPTSSGQV